MKKDYLRPNIVILSCFPPQPYDNSIFLYKFANKLKNNNPNL